MKLSDCKLGIVVQNKDKTYDEAMIGTKFYGHISGIDENNHVVVTRVINRSPTIIGRFKPEQLKLLED